MKNLTLYSAKICPFAQRVTFALAHLEVPHQLVEIDLQNKPKDYATINRALKVPVLQIEHTATGGRKSSAYFPESLIILELLSDLYPYKIMSEDALKRAESRYFVSRYAEVVTPNFIKYIYGEDQSAIAPLLAGLKEIQGLLTANEGHYFQGDSVSYADFAVAPFLGRMLTFGKAGLIAGDFYEKLMGNEELRPIINYTEQLMDLPAFKATFDTEYLVGKAKANMAKKKADADAAAAKA